MGVPKRKTSKARVRSRKEAHRRTYVAAKPCPQCGSPQQPHHVCNACGYYRGRQVKTIVAA